MSYTRSMLFGVIAGLSLTLAFAAGFIVRDLSLITEARALSTTASEEPGYPLVDEVQDLLDRVYLRDQPEYATRQYAAIRGMLATLGDNNTFFIEPPVARSEADSLAGTYGGIGVQLRRDEAGQFVLYPFPDGPAVAGGIVDGDVLIAIKSESITADMQQDAVDQMMRGEVKDGNGVDITVQRDNNTTYSTYIEFAVINVPSVIWRVMSEDERIGYLQVLRFTNRTPGEVTDAVSSLRESGIEALILDLRNNSGGLLEESVTVAGLFLDGGIVTYEISKNNERELTAAEGGIASDLPLVVLVNNRTASASELVAGAIRDTERGIIIGQKTYGKGTVQQIFGLSDGSSVHITSAEWFTPARIPLDGDGLEPTISMIPDANGRDVESGEAIRYLQDLLN